jgi:hypothetical protein
VSHCAWPILKIFKLTEKLLKRKHPPSQIQPYNYDIPSVRPFRTPGKLPTNVNKTPD